MRTKAKGKGDTIITSSQELKKQDTTPNFNLTVLQRLRDGLRPVQIARELKLSQSALQYHLNQLKAAGLITKIGYGCWEVITNSQELKKQDTERTKKTNQVTLDKALKLKYLGLPDSVRGHSFVFTLRVPENLTNWRTAKREDYLTHHGIGFELLRIPGGGERLWLEGRKIWLTNKSIIIYERDSYFAETAGEARKHALFSFIALIKKLERVLNADFTHKLGKEYQFKVSRQHYALVKNALAEQYDSEGKQLFVRLPDTGKLWFIIDNSFNLHEAETIAADSAVGDNHIVQNFFNSLKAHPITASEVLELVHGIATNQMIFDRNMQSHIEAIKALHEGVTELNRIIQQWKS